MNDNQNGQNVMSNQNNGIMNTSEAPQMPAQQPVPNTNSQPMPEQATVESVSVPVSEPQPVQPVPTADNVIQPEQTPVQVANPQPMPVSPEAPVAPTPTPNVGPQPVQPTPVQQPIQQPMPMPNNPAMNQAQPNQMYNPGMPVGNTNYVQNVPENKNKKFLIIGGAVAGAVILLILIIVLAGGKYKKVLSCDLNFNISGVNGTENIKFYINDGELAITQTRIYNLDKFDSKYYPTKESKDAFAQSHINSGKNEACSSGQCTYSYSYLKNKKLKETVKYSESQSIEIVGSGAQGKTAQEIYDKLKTNIETTGLSGMPYTCK